MMISIRLVPELRRYLDWFRLVRVEEMEERHKAIYAWGYHSILPNWAPRGNSANVDTMPTISQGML